MTDDYENGYQAGRFDGYVEAMEIARDDAAELRAAGHQSVRLIEWLSSREGTALEGAAEAEALVSRLRAALAATEGES